MGKVMSSIDSAPSKEARELHKKKEMIFLGVLLALTGLIIIDVALFDLVDAAFGNKMARAVGIFFGVVLAGAFIVKWGLNLINKASE